MKSLSTMGDTRSSFLCSSSSPAICPRFLSTSSIAPRTVSVTVLRFTGFVRYLYAPRFSASCAYWNWSKALRIMTTVSGLDWAMYLSVSSPFSPGMLMSMKMMSMGCFAAISSASVPDSAECSSTCVGKFFLMMNFRESIIICSSSVSSMLYIVRYPYQECGAAVGVAQYIKNIVAVEIEPQP